MRVALDTNGLYTTQAGVARHIRGLIKGLRETGRAGFEFFPLAWEVENFGYQQPQRAARTFYRELVWPKLVAPGILLREQADLLHSTVEVLVAPDSKLPHVATLHDLAVLRYPARFRRWHRFATTRRLRRLHQVSRVICISQATADEAISLLDLSPRTIDVVHNGCDFHSADPGTKLLNLPPELKLPRDFFLFVGSLEPGKNLSLLAEVYRSVKPGALPALVIVGARWEGVARESAPPADWHYLGRQPDEVLVALYQRALALLFPSKYEGFGLPVAEAMASGCPVICSPVSSLPEVGGDAVLFSEMTPESYLRCMQQLLDGPGVRAQLIQRGKTQAQKFTWQRCAEQTVQVYRTALGS